MSSFSRALTDAQIAAVISSATVNGKLTDAGIAGVISAATVGGALAGLAWGNVGSIVTATEDSGGDKSAGSTLAGSALMQAGFAVPSGSYNGSQAFSGVWASVSLSGTWMCLGRSAGVSGSSQAITTWRRVA